jgi:hypothetical protein
MLAKAYPWIVGLAFSAIVFFGLYRRVREQFIHKGIALAGLTLFASAFLLYPSIIFDGSFGATSFTAVALGLAGIILLIFARYKRKTG